MAPILPPTFSSHGIVCGSRQGNWGSDDTRPSFTSLLMTYVPPMVWRLLLCTPWRAGSTVRHAEHGPPGTGLSLGDGQTRTRARGGAGMAAGSAPAGAASSAIVTSAPVELAPATRTGSPLGAAGPPQPASERAPGARGRRNVSSVARQEGYRPPSTMINGIERNRLCRRRRRCESRSCPHPRGQ